MKKIDYVFLGEKVEIWSDDKFPNDVDYLKVGKENVYHPEKGELFYNTMKKEMNYVFMWTGSGWVPVTNKLLSDEKIKELLDLGMILTYNGSKFQEWSMKVVEDGKEKLALRATIGILGEKYVNFYAKKGYEKVLIRLYEILL